MTHLLLISSCSSRTLLLLLSVSLTSATMCHYSYNYCKLYTYERALGMIAYMHNNLLQLIAPLTTVGRYNDWIIAA